MEDHRFDELTKSLTTSGVSRRQLLKGLAGGFAGTVLATVFPKRAWGANFVPGPGNSPCAHFCAMVFGADTPGADACTSAAAHHQGLCFTCGPASTTGQVICGTVCCPAGQACCSGVCTDLTSDANNCGTCGNVCPAAGEICSGSTCVCPTGTVLCTPASGGATTCAANVCPTGQVFDPTTCMCAPVAHPECTGATCTNFLPCSSSNPDCVCATTDAGGVCVPGSTSCSGLAACATSADCATGELCYINTCCGPGVCAPAALAASCPTGAAAPITAIPRSSTSGPSFASR